jgi:hypothetical protein
MFVCDRPSGTVPTRERRSFRDFLTPELAGGLGPSTLVPRPELFASCLEVDDRARVGLPNLDAALLLDRERGLLWPVKELTRQVKKFRDPLRNPLAVRILITYLLSGIIHTL